MIADNQDPLLSVCPPQRSSQLQVQESGVRYNQSVQYDPITADVINHVPRYSNSTEHVTI